MKRITGLIAVVACLATIATWFVHRQRVRALNSGDVFLREQGPEIPTPSRDLQVEQAHQSATVTTTASVEQLTTPPSEQASVPDSMARNPPDRMVFAGSGKFQLYRQGDITWRVNTDTGAACILFATDMQWSRPRIYQHGCMGSARTSPAIGD